VFGILQQIIGFALRYIEGYYFECKVWKVKALSLGGVYLEKIVHHQLKNNVNFTVSRGSYLFGLVTTLTVRSGVRASNINDGEHVAIEMSTTQPEISSEEEDDENEDEDDVVQVVEDNNTVETVSYADVYSSNSTDDKIVYDDEEITSIRASLQEYTTRNSSKLSPIGAAADKPFTPVSRGSMTAQVVISDTKIDVDNISLVDLLKQYRADMSRVDTDAGHTTDVDDALFEEWKRSKRKQFKAGTRKSFVKAYNLYEDLFSKNTYTSSKQTAISTALQQSASSGKNSKDSGGMGDTVVTENPLLKAAASSSTSPTVSSAENTRKLFSQQSLRGKNSLDTKNKKKI
jgi:hypothetical protein